MTNSFGARSTLRVGDNEYEIYRLDALEQRGINLGRLPFSLRILLENLLRTEDGRTVTADDVHGLAGWEPKAEPDRGDRLHARPRPAAGLHRRARGGRPGRDARRDGRRWAATPSQINPLQPVELVIDHSVQVDEFGTEARLPDQRRAGVRAQPRALRLPALGPDRVPATSASCRPTPASCTR